MDRLDVGDLGRADHRWNIQIALGQLRRSDADGFVGKADGQRVPVGFAINRDRADAQFLARANHAQRNLATIGYEDLLEHEVRFPAVTKIVDC